MRKSPTYEDARAYLNAYFRQFGCPPTIDQMRKAHGDQGSKSTYSDFINRWKAEKELEPSVEGKFAALRAQINQNCQIALIGIEQLEKLYLQDIADRSYLSNGMFSESEDSASDDAGFSPDPYDVLGEVEAKPAFSGDASAAEQVETVGSPSAAGTADAWLSANGAALIDEQLLDEVADEARAYFLDEDPEEEDSAGVNDDLARLREPSNSDRGESDGA